MVYLALVNCEIEALRTLQAEHENTVTRYLLGELSEAEMSALEARYFDEPEIFDQVLAAETKLVDDYARNRLSDEMRERFEKGYMANSARRERVKFAEALAVRLDSVEEATPPRQSILAWLTGHRPSLAFSMAVASLLITIGVIWLFIESSRRSPDELVRVPTAGNEVPPIDQSKVQPQSSPPDSQSIPTDEPSPPKASVTPDANSAPRSVSLALAIGGLRSGDASRTPVLVIPRGTSEARLVLNLRENAYDSYRLVLQTVAGREIASRTIVKPKGPNLVLTIPADRLASGDHILTVTGIEDDGNDEALGGSLFRVKK